MDLPRPFNFVTVAVNSPTVAHDVPLDAVPLEVNPAVPGGSCGVGQLVLECLFDAMGNDAVVQSCSDTSLCWCEI